MDMRRVHDVFMRYSLGTIKNNDKDDSISKLGEFAYILQLIRTGRMGLGAYWTLRLGLVAQIPS